MIRAMPERKRFFYIDVSPYYHVVTIVSSSLFIQGAPSPPDTCTTLGRPQEACQRHGIQSRKSCRDVLPPPLRRS